ncbi:MAG: hypothetical protein AB1429_02525 [Pseudomonadota bacterium]|jgi:hypothetical protein
MSAVFDRRDEPEADRQVRRVEAYVDRVRVNPQQARDELRRVYMAYKRTRAPRIHPAD